MAGMKAPIARWLMNRWEWEERYKVLIAAQKKSVMRKINARANALKKDDLIEHIQCGVDVVMLKAAMESFFDGVHPTVGKKKYTSRGWYYTTYAMAMPTPEAAARTLVKLACQLSRGSAALDSPWGCDVRYDNISRPMYLYWRKLPSIEQLPADKTVGWPPGDWFKASCRMTAFDEWDKNAHTYKDE